jgi:NDP-sugar pyrophosphorylase family protein
MADVLGRPFLEWILRALRAQGIQRVVMCIGHMGERIQRHFGDGREAGLEIHYSEDEGLGTGGALRAALPLIESDPVLALNGDSYCEADVRTFLAWHQDREACGSLALAHVRDTGRYGRVHVDGNGRILRFEEKERSDPGWINAGMYLLAVPLIASIPTGRPVSIERELFPAWVGAELYGFPTHGGFIDIGTPESYLQAESFFLGMGGVGSRGDR